jgi:hypothetical protein
MRIHRLATVSTLLTLLVATVAFAFTEAELLDRAIPLDADLDALHARFVADTEPHSVLKAEFDVLDAELDQLEADRATLPPSCGCTQLDQTLAAASATAAELQRTITAWEETN